MSEVFFSYYFTSVRKSCSYARIFVAKDYTDQAKLSADEILLLGANSYTTTSFLPPAYEALNAESAHRTFEKVFTSPLVRAQYSPASDDIEVVSWWWLGVPTTWLPPLHHHHTASENITSYTPTPSTSDVLIGDLFLEIFCEERQKMIYCSNCLAGISREYFVVWAASPLNIVQQGGTGLAKTQLN